MTTYLNLTGTSGAYAYTVDDSSLDITGDLDIRADVSLADWTPAANQTIVSKYLGASNQRSYQLQVDTQGRLRFIHSADGLSPIPVESTAAVGATNGQRLGVRVTIDVDNGSSGRTVRFYVTAPDLINTEVWLPLGNPVTTAGVTSIFSSSIELAVGAENQGVDSRLVGKVYAAQVRDGISGTVVAYPIFSAWTTGTTSFTDQAGRTWVRAGASTIVDDGATPPSMDDLNGLSQQNYGVDLNRGLQLASGVRKDVNGVAHTLWGPREAFSRRGQIAALLKGGGVVEESAPPHEGMTLTFEDDFETLDTTRWTPHPWFVFDWDGVTVEDSILKLQMTDDLDPDHPSTALTTLGVRDPDNIPHYPNALSWQEGYFEARIRFTNHGDAYPYFWLLSAEHPQTWPDGDQCPLLRCEWDIMELGLSSSDPNTTTWMNSHRNNVALCEQPQSATTNRRNLAGINLSDWHVWGGLWKDGMLTQFIDGVPTIKAPAPDSFNQPMYLILSCNRHVGH